MWWIVVGVGLAGVLWVLEQRIPGTPPLGAMVFGPLSAATAVYDVAAQRMVPACYFAAIAALNLWIVWDWWRRRKQRKPSRVLGLVRNLGHKLTVVPVPSGGRP